MDNTKTKEFVDSHWQGFVDALSNFVRVPNLTPSCSDTFYTDGLTQKAYDVVDAYAQSLNLKGLSMQEFDLDGKAPKMRVYNIEANMPENLAGYKHVMCYGHVDKQPWGPNWDTSPNDPVIIGDKMFGRGSSDDGYASFAAFLSIKNLQEQGVPTPKFTILLEAEEESGSAHILDLLDTAKEAIGTPDIIFILDSGTLDYKSTWVTSSLRGIVNVDCHLDVLTGGVHSGSSGGMVPEAFRIMRILLDRIEDPLTGMVKLPEVSSPVPERYLEQAKATVADVGDTLWKSMPLVEGCEVINQGNNLELYLRNTWHAAAAVIGFNGLPPALKAGNAMNPRISFRISVRISPDRHPDEAAEALMKALTTDVPYGAKIECDASHRGFGYNMKPLNDRLTAILDETSREWHGPSCKYYGLGATIPLLAELQKKFPACDIIATGVLGVDTNAHGPNENLDLPYMKKFLGQFGSMLGKL